MNICLPLAFAPASQPSPWVSMVPMILIVAIFYFLLIMPMRRRQKAHQKLLGDLKKGDRVVTTGGIHGEVASVEGDVVHLKIADNVKIKVSKAAVGGLQGGEQLGGAK